MLFRYHGSMGRLMAKASSLILKILLGNSTPRPRTSALFCILHSAPQIHNLDHAKAITASTSCQASATGFLRDLETRLADRFRFRVCTTTYIMCEHIEPVRSGRMRHHIPEIGIRPVELVGMPSRISYLDIWVNTPVSKHKIKLLTA
jgi:hypothetical protein